MNVFRLLAVVTLPLILMLLIQSRPSHIHSTRHFDFLPISSEIVNVYQVIHLREQRDILLFRHANRSRCASVIHHCSIESNILGSEMILITVGPTSRGNFPCLLHAYKAGFKILWNFPTSNPGTSVSFLSLMIFCALIIFAVAAPRKLH